MKPDHDLQHELDELKKNVNDIKDLFVQRISQTVNRVPEAIRQGEEKVAHRVEEHPLTSVGLAAAVGFILGALFTRK